MCGRITLAVPTYRDLAAILGAYADSAAFEHYRPRFNIAPMSAHMVLRVKEGRREIVPARWGLIPRWSKDAGIAAHTINARSETAAQKPAFRDAFEKRRCIVPADGFYEWEGEKGHRRPLWFHPKEGGLLLLAGLYEHWTNPEDGEDIRTFTILTTASNDFIAPIHDRMPAFIKKEQLDQWLMDADKMEALHMLKPAENDYLVAQAASRRVNSVSYDGPDLLYAEPEAVEMQTPSYSRMGEGRGAKKKEAEPEQQMSLFSAGFSAGTDGEGIGQKKRRRP